MKEIELINKKIEEAEKRIKELSENNDLRKLVEQEKHKVSEFYKKKCFNRLETAKLIFTNSKSPENRIKNEMNNNYSDFSEVVSAAYYSMYYTVHAFLAAKYGRKLKEEVRGVHAITCHLVLYYLVKTERLAKHLYGEYVKALETAAEVQKFDLDEYQKQAFGYVKQYQEQREKREIFTYHATKDAEENQADLAIKSAEKFINTIRQLMTLR